MVIPETMYLRLADDIIKKLAAPYHNKPSFFSKQELAKSLQQNGYSFRQIAKIMNYKSPRSIQVLLEQQ